MQAIKKIGKINTSGWVRPEVFNVTPDLLGMPLARPSKRALAIGVDAAVIALLSSFGSLWLMAGIAIAGLQLWKIRAQSWTKKIWLVLVLILLALISGEKMLNFYNTTNTPTTIAQNEIEIKKTGDEGDLTVASAASSASKLAAIDQETVNK